MMLQTYSLMQLFGLGSLGLGLVGILFSPYRHWLLFMLAGMFSWTLLEGIRIGAQSLFALTMFQGYLVGVAVALGLLAIWFASTETSRQQRRHALRLSQQIEHTPLYREDLEMS